MCDPTGIHSLSRCMCEQWVESRQKNTKWETMMMMLKIEKKIYIDFKTNNDNAGDDNKNVYMHPSTHNFCVSLFRHYDCYSINAWISFFKRMNVCPVQVWSQSSCDLAITKTNSDKTERCRHHRRCRSHSKKKKLPKEKWKEKRSRILFIFCEQHKQKRKTTNETTNKAKAEKHDREMLWINGFLFGVQLFFFAPARFIPFQVVALHCKTIIIHGTTKLMHTKDIHPNRVKFVT